MNIFGMGFEEIAVIMVIALIVFGPGKLPEVMGQIGKAIRDFRRMTADLTGEFEKNFGTDLNDLRQQLTGLTSEVASVSESVKRDLVGTPSTASSSTTSSWSSDTASTTDTATVQSVSETVSSYGSTNGSAHVAPMPIASKRDPLADVSLLEETVPLTVDDHSSVSDDTDGHADGHAQAVAAVPSTPNGATAAAVARARQRRQTASYGRRSTTRPS